MKLSDGLIGFFALSSIAWASPHKSVYRNADYGITLPIPDAAQMCPVPAEDVTHHGAQFLLGTNDIRLCKVYSGKRYVLVWAQFNIADDTKTLHAFFQWQCGEEAKGQCQTPPAGLQINGLPSEAGRVDHPDGTIEILVVTQAGKPNPDFDSTVPANNYQLSLVTNAQSFDQDLAVFREFLSSIRISPDRHK
jgi:hypothetical protein